MSQRVDIAIIVPTTKEYAVIIPEIRDLLKDRILRDDRGYPRHHVLTNDVNPSLFSFSSVRLDSGSANEGQPYLIGFYCSAEMGNIFSAAMTGYVINMHSPGLIISGGIAGCIDTSELRLGDVVIPEAIQHVVYDKIGDVGGLIRDEKRYSVQPFETFSGEKYYYRVNHSNMQNIVAMRSFYAEQIAHLRGKTIDSRHYSQEFKSLLGNGDFKAMNRSCQIVSSCSMLSWEKVLNSSSYIKQACHSINALRSCIAVDMESYGFLKTIELSGYDTKTRALVIRGISDYVGLKHVSDDDATDWRELAMKNVASTIVNVILANTPFAAKAD